MKKMLNKASSMIFMVMVIAMNSIIINNIKFMKQSIKLSVDKNIINKRSQKR